MVKILKDFEKWNECARTKREVFERCLYSWRSYQQGIFRRYMADKQFREKVVEMLIDNNLYPPKLYLRDRRYLQLRGRRSW